MIRPNAIRGLAAAFSCMVAACIAGGAEVKTQAKTCAVDRYALPKSEAKAAQYELFWTVNQRLSSTPTILHLRMRVQIWGPTATVAKARILAWRLYGNEVASKAQMRKDIEGSVFSFSLPRDGGIAFSPTCPDDAKKPARSTAKFLCAKAFPLLFLKIPESVNLEVGAKWGEKEEDEKESFSDRADRFQWSVRGHIPVGRRPDLYVLWSASTDTFENKLAGNALRLSDRLVYYDAAKKRVSAVRCVYRRQEGLKPGSADPEKYEYEDLSLMEVPRRGSRTKAEPFPKIEPKSVPERRATKTDKG